MRQILNTYNAVELRRFISKANIKGITKMKKADLINEMTKAKHIGNFKHIKAKGEKKEAKKEAPKIDIRKSKPTDAFLRIKAQIKKKGEAIIKSNKDKAKEQAKKQVPTITITEAKKKKKKPTQEIKSSLGKIPTPKIKIRVAPKPAPKKAEKPKKKDKEDIQNDKNTKLQKEIIKLLKDNKDKLKKDDFIRVGSRGHYRESSLYYELRDKIVNRSMYGDNKETEERLKFYMKELKDHIKRKEPLKLKEEQTATGRRIKKEEEKKAPKKEEPKKKPDRKEQQKKLKEKIKEAGGKEAYLRELGKKTKGRQGGKLKKLAEFKPKKKAPKKEKKNRDVLDDMDDRKEEIKQLRLKIKKTKDKIIKKKLEEELKILKNKPIIEKATIKEAPKRAPPKKDDELEAFLASFKEGGATSPTTKKQQSKPKETPAPKKKEAPKFINPIQKIKNYINNDLVKDYKTMPKKGEYTKEKRTIIKKLKVLQGNLVDSDIPYNLDNLAKEFTNNIDKVAKENDIHISSNRLDVFKRGLGLIQSNQSSAMINTLKERQQDIDKLENTLAFLKTIDEKRLKKSGQVIDDLRTIDRMESGIRYRANKKKTDEEKKIRAEISKRMRKKDYLKDVYKLSSFNLGLLYALKGLPEKIYYEAQKIKTPELPPQFDGSRGQTKTKKQLIELYQGFIKKQRKNELND